LRTVANLQTYGVCECSCLQWFGTVLSVDLVSYLQEWLHERTAVLCYTYCSNILYVLTLLVLYYRKDFYKMRQNSSNMKQWMLHIMSMGVCILTLVIWNANQHLLCSITLPYLVCVSVQYLLSCFITNRTKFGIIYWI